jgi:transcriptional regulator with XRE-family HTH domain
MTISSEQVRAARALLRWEQRDLAEASKVSLPSIKRLEMTPGALAAQPRTITAIRTALEAAGIEFTNGGRPGVRVDILGMRHLTAELRPKIDAGLKLVGKDVQLEVNDIRKVDYQSTEEPYLSLEAFARLRRLQRILEAAGVEFTNGGQPGVRMRKKAGS